MHEKAVADWLDSGMPVAAAIRGGTVPAFLPAQNCLEEFEIWRQRHRPDVAVTPIWFGRTLSPYMRKMGYSSARDCDYRGFTLTNVVQLESTKGTSMWREPASNDRRAVMGERADLRDEVRRTDAFMRKALGVGGEWSGVRGALVTLARQVATELGRLRADLGDAKHMHRLNPPQEAAQTSPCPFCGREPVAFCEVNARTGNFVATVACSGSPECNAVQTRTAAERYAAERAVVESWNVRRGAP